MSHDRPETRVDPLGFLISRRRVLCGINDTVGQHWPQLILARLANPLAWGTALSDFFRLDGKIAFVTGGGQGIGEAICRRLAKAGAKVGVFDRNAAAAQRVALAIAGHAVAGDVTSEADVETAIEDVRDHLGPVDILVNNAGITGKAGKLWELAKADWESVLV